MVFLKNRQFWASVKCRLYPSSKVSCAWFECREFFWTASGSWQSYAPHMCWHGWHTTICCHLRRVNKNKLSVGICTSFDITRETSYKRDDIFDMVFIYNHLLFVLSVLLLTTERSSAEGADQSGTRTLSLEKSIVWGPGLKSRFSLPVRYFFIQAVDQFGEKYVLFFLLSFNIKVPPPRP